jgi:predicted phosphodiesterase
MKKASEASMTKRHRGIAVFSDIHGNLEALNVVMRKAKELNVDAIYSLGDVVGYGPEPVECLRMAADFGLNIIGNHEDIAFFKRRASGDKILSHAAEKSLDWTKKQVEGSNTRKYMENFKESVLRNGILYVHGKPTEPITGYIHTDENPFSIVTEMNKMDERRARICFCGHTHTPSFFRYDKELESMLCQVIRDQRTNEHLHEPFDSHTPFEQEVMLKKDETCIINAGSVGQPRDGDPRACFLVYDGKAGSYEKVTFYRVPYDIEATQSKIIKSGLPGKIAEIIAARLKSGR